MMVEMVVWSVPLGECEGVFVCLWKKKNKKNKKKKKTKKQKQQQPKWGRKGMASQRDKEIMWKWVVGKDGVGGKHVGLKKKSDHAPHFFLFFFKKLGCYNTYAVCKEKGREHATLQWL